MRLSIVVPCVVFALAICSASAQTPLPRTPPLTSQERADIAKIRSLHTTGANRSYSRTLDFSDPQQYRYFMAEIARAGLTAERYPQLFKSIEQTRQTQVARRRSKKAAIADAPMCPNDQVCPVNIITTLGAPGSNQLYFQSNALTSVPNNPPVATNTLGLYDQNGTVFAPPLAVMDHNTGYDLENSVTGTAPAQTTQAQARGVYYYGAQEDSSEGVGGSLYAEASVGEQVQIHNTSPTNVKGNQQIKICVTRQDSDCDYFYQAIGGQQVVQFPIIGDVTYPNPIAADANNHPLNGIGSVTLAQPVPNQGGGCAPLPVNQSLVGSAIVSGNSVNWTINPGQFGVATPCFPSNSTVVYDLMLTVYDTSQKPWVISITSEQGPPISDTLRILPMSVLYGCLAEGTLVTMADETRRPIESVRVGEVIRSNEKRIPLTVDNYTKGYEKTPMVSITTTSGRSLLLTEGHPVITTAGAKLASKLRVGDVVITDTGEAKLVKVERQQFNGNVWNLDVGRPTDRVQLTDTNTTFYANGILVGDRQMQGRMTRAEKESPAAIRASLDPKWLQDFDNYQIDKQARRAAP